MTAAITPRQRAVLQALWQAQQDADLQMVTAGAVASIVAKHAPLHAASPGGTAQSLMWLANHGLAGQGVVAASRHGEQRRVFAITREGADELLTKAAW